MKEQSLLSKQVFIVLYLSVAALSCIETAAQYTIGGFGNWKVYLFASIFITSVILYFRSKSKRFADKNKTVK